jgi:hypothetical protein
MADWKKGKKKEEKGRDDGPDLVEADEILLDLAWQKVAEEEARKRPGLRRPAKGK